MYTHITAKDLKEGDLVIHSGTIVEILAVEVIDNWIINCCTIGGGRVSFSVDSRVKKFQRKTENKLVQTEKLAYNVFIKSGRVPDKTKEIGS